MGNSVRYYPGYGYVPAQGCVLSGPPVLSRRCQGGGVHTLRVQDQAKQAAHTRPPISIGLSMEWPFGNTGPQAGKYPRDR
jgi:hypothetical protein